MSAHRHLTKGRTGTKTSYATADVQLSTGLWTLNDALIGNLTTDRKTGAASARIRNTGSLTMVFDLSGAGTVHCNMQCLHDGSSTWNCGNPLMVEIL